MRTSNTIYVIRDKQTEMFVLFGTKVAWSSVGAAKNAYNYHVPKYPDKHKFDDQTAYEVVAISA